MVPNASPHALTLLGRDFEVPGAVEARSVGPRTAAALSVGGPAVIERKAEEGTGPNEDCLFAWDDGRHALHLLADGHHGPESSHGLILGLAAIFGEKGPDFDPVEALGLLHERTPAGFTKDRSRSTLMIACLDREAGSVRGLSIGDSACFVGDEASLRRVDQPNHRYAAPWSLHSLGVPPSSRFEVPISQGDWLLTCSDGVTECHYGQPETSIRPGDLQGWIRASLGDPLSFVRSVTEGALAGVRGHPGGEDNVAVVASAAEPDAGSRGVEAALQVPVA